ncbi:MAG: hypothetical protein M3Q99_11670, partial [Acidobacteriota bacterium]|nr:hypothetical protein [Acidobacteriota bacterium]
MTAVEKTKSQPKRRKSPWGLGIFVLVSLTFLILLQTSNLWKELSVDSASDTVLLYALSSLNFFAFVIFGFILLRNLIKLARERRSLELGAKFKTRLWFYFFAISLLPIIAMAGFSYLFMNRAVERWFTQIPENVVRAPIKVQDQAIKLQSEKFRETSKMLAMSLEKHDFTNEELSSISEAGNLIRIEVLSQTNQTLGLHEKFLPLEQKAELDKIVGLVKNGRLDEPPLRDGIGFDAAAADFSDGRKLIVVSNLYSEENVSQLVENALAEFDKLKEKQINIRQIGLLTLGVLTFLLIFASSWTAFHIARG